LKFFSNGWHYNALPITCKIILEILKEVMVGKKLTEATTQAITSAATTRIGMHILNTLKMRQYKASTESLVQPRRTLYIIYTRGLAWK
jgi:hypothetical protein